MQVVTNPAKEQWKTLLERPAFDPLSLEKKIKKVLNKVKKDGDKAIRKFTKEFDSIKIKNIQVSNNEISQGVKLLSDELRDAILAAKENIKRFHAAQLVPEKSIETMPGVKCWRKSVGLEKVGLYIPGGTAPLFSTVLMLGIPAKLAGCKEIIVCTPPQKDGTVHPAVLFAADKAGITKIFKVGGAQAIGAMAYGTESVPKVDKIFGPGNQFVTCAKQLIQRDGIAIDMPAGPSEVCVLADETANARYVAADLLSQAEHGPDSQVLLVTTSRKLIDSVTNEIKLQLKDLPRSEYATKALANSKFMLLEKMEDAIDLVNEYAAEHLIISCEAEDIIADKIINAGSIFIGKFSPESAGDYASGTNHTLPTNGFAKAYSGVSVDSFVKKITYQKLTEAGLRNIASIVTIMAVAEGLTAHANAVRLRIDH